MGEWSKSLGEKGERITKFLFEEIIGINSLAESTSVDCKRIEQHKRKEAKGNRKTHRLDGLYYYKSPMEDEVLDIVMISSKYNNFYPKSPRSKFKSHFVDLAQAMECFKFSKLHSDISQSFSSVSKTAYTGILVWLSNQDGVNDEIISQVSNTLIRPDLEFEKIILVDNARVNFLFETVYKSKLEFKDVDYVYHNSSLNHNSINSSAYGKIFPIEYLYSDIIILRVELLGKIQFLIFVNDNFSSENLSLILSFAKTFDHLNAIDKTLIKYLDYESSVNEKQLKSVLAHYSNFKLGQNLEISKFPFDFRK